MPFTMARQKTLNCAEGARTMNIGREEFMADTKIQNQTSEQQRNIARRQDYQPSRDPLNFSPFAMMRRLSDEMERAFSSTFGLSRWFGDSETWTPAVEIRERNG